MHTDDMAVVIQAENTNINEKNIIDLNCNTAIICINEKFRTSLKIIFVTRSVDEKEAVINYHLC